MKVRALAIVDADIEQIKVMLKGLYDEKRAVKAWLADRQQRAADRKRLREKDKQRLVPIVEAPLHEDITTLKLHRRAIHMLMARGITKVGHLFLIDFNIYWAPGTGRKTVRNVEESLITAGTAVRGGKKVKNAVAVPAEVVAEYEAFLQAHREEEAEREEKQRLRTKIRMLAEVEARERQREQARKHAEKWGEFRKRKEKGQASQTIGDPNGIFIRVLLLTPDHPHPLKYVLQPGFWAEPKDSDRYMAIEERAADIVLDNFEDATAMAEQMLATLN